MPFELQIKNVFFKLYFPEFVSLTWGDVSLTMLHMLAQKIFYSLMSVLANYGCNLSSNIDTNKYLLTFKKTQSTRHFNFFKFWSKHFVPDNYRTSVADP